MQIDHIIPLVVGGTNEIDNLQILCKPCHFSKSKSEQESDQYVKKNLHRYHHLPPKSMISLIHL